MGSTPSGISGSRAAAVLAMSKWATPVDVWLRIMEERRPGFAAENGYQMPPDPDNAAIRWGTGFENAVIELAEEARLKEIFEREASFILADKPAAMGTSADIIDRGKFPAITCHIDGRYEDGILHEGKTTNAMTFRESWGEPGTDHVPREYFIQTQHQMLCTGAEKCIISVLVFPKRVDEFEEMGWFPEDDQLVDVEHGPGLHNIFASDWAKSLYQMGYFHQYEINADPGLHAEMLSAYEHFWTEYVLKEIPPPARTYNDIKALIPNPKGTVVADETIIRLSAEYKDLIAEKSKISKRQDELKAQMIGAIDRGAEHPIDDDSVEAIVIRSPEGRKMHSYSKGKRGMVFR